MNKNIPKLTVESLRKSGGKVRCIHERRVCPNLKALKEILKPVYSHISKGSFNNLSKLEVKIPQVISNFGGITTIELDTKDGRYYKGVAICSVKDTFNRKRGIKIALHEIAKQAQVNGEAI
jgi:hypothetical protein